MIDSDFQLKNDKNKNIMATLANTISADKKLVNEIAKASKYVGSGRYVVAYYAENSDRVIISTVQQGWTTRGEELAFGCRLLTKKQVIAILDREMQNF